MALPTTILLLLLLLLFATLVRSQDGTTNVGFYSSSCPRAESIVRATVQSHFQSDPTIAPGILRMHFHDCFVDGCDGSVLISGSNTERTAGANLGLRGFEVIDDAKTQLEATCPGVVSCADILALAARDSVVMTGGLSWQVPTGRRDGRVSIASHVDNLPSPTDSVFVQKQKFLAFGLNTQDLVALVGAHTIGTTDCQFVSYRLYNFTNTGSGADTTINPSFVAQLRSLCPKDGGGSTGVALDIGSSNRFDSSYFRNLKNRRGILESDQKLWTDASTNSIVRRFMRASTFKFEFGKSMVKMSNIGVKSLVNGEIRKVCSAVN